MNLRAFLSGLWLQWQIESNWADPFLFAIYVIIRPVASVVTLVVMYSAASTMDFEAPYFSCLYIGSSFYVFVGSMIHGVSWGIIDDREHHKTLKYLCISPTRLPVFLIGRGVANYALAGISVLILMLTGIIFLKVGISWATIDYYSLLMAIVSGVIYLSAMGLVLAAFSLVMAHHLWFIGDMVAGSMFIFSGAVFPQTALPAWLQSVGLGLPVTYWLELLRRALIGDGASAFNTWASWSEMQLWGAFGLSTVLWWIGAAVLFPICFNHARDRGYLDMTSNY